MEKNMDMKWKLGNIGSKDLKLSTLYRYSRTFQGVAGRFLAPLLRPK